MLSHVMISSTKKGLNHFSASGDAKSDPNRLAAHHALAALEAYDDLQFNVAFDEITTACEILNNHHHASAKLRSLINNLYTAIQKKRKEQE